MSNSPDHPVQQELEILNEKHEQAAEQKKELYEQNQLLHGSTSESDADDNVIPFTPQPAEEEVPEEETIVVFTPDPEDSVMKKSTAKKPAARKAPAAQGASGQNASAKKRPAASDINPAKNGFIKREEDASRIARNSEVSRDTSDAPAHPFGPLAAMQMEFWNEMTRAWLGMMTAPFGSQR